MSMKPPHSLAADCLSVYSRETLESSGPLDGSHMVGMVVSGGDPKMVSGIPSKMGSNNISNDTNSFVFSISTQLRLCAAQSWAYLFPRKHLDAATLEHQSRLPLTRMPHSKTLRRNQQRFAVLRLPILPEKAWFARGEGVSTNNATVHANMLSLHLMALIGITQGMKLKNTNQLWTKRPNRRRILRTVLKPPLSEACLTLFIPIFVELFQLGQDFFGDLNQLWRSHRVTV